MKSPFTTTDPVYEEPVTIDRLLSIVSKVRKTLDDKFPELKGIDPGLEIIESSFIPENMTIMRSQTQTIVINHEKGTAFAWKHKDYDLIKTMPISHP